MNTDKKPARSRTSEMRIGKVVYIVTAYYSEQGRETAEDKLFRLVSDRVSAEINSPQNTVK